MNRRSSHTKRLLLKNLEDHNHKSLQSKPIPLPNDCGSYQQERIHRTETNILRDAREDSYSYPTGIQRSIHQTNPNNKPSISILSGQQTDLHRQPDDDESFREQIVPWSAESKLSADDRRMIANVHHDITQEMAKSIEDQKNKSSDVSLLSKAIEITGMRQIERMIFK